jgi:glycosyltransferase involved in cell wall biosynthesis
MKKSMIYIGHTYHLRTLSTRFLIDIFKESYNVDEAVYSLSDGGFIEANYDPRREYDVLVVFQMGIPVSELKDRYIFKKAVFVPMFDSHAFAPGIFWEEYKDFIFINFSSTLHRRLSDMGFSSYFVRYYPKPVGIAGYGDSESAFFWQRVNQITINTVAPLLSRLGVKRIHMHTAIDPEHNITAPDCGTAGLFAITASQWFDNRADMHELINNSSYYAAPRVYEGIGMSFLEAMAMGRCVIAVNHPTMNEYIQDGENGILYDYYTKQIRTPRNLKQLQENAHGSIVSGYETWEREKYNILEWIGRDAKTDYVKLDRYISEVKRAAELQKKQLELAQAIISETKKTRPVALYGYGFRGREIYSRSMEQIDYIIDAQALPDGKYVSPEDMGKLIPKNVFVVISTLNDADIALNLESLGFIHERDYVRTGRLLR